jgi:Ca2+-binding RTX toxin-like protein
MSSCGVGLRLLVGGSAEVMLLPAVSVVWGAGEAAAQRVQTCAGVPATIVGTGRMTEGTEGPDVIVASDVVLARGRDDLVCTRSRSDGVSGGSGDDEIHGGHGDDYLSGDAGNDVLYGDKGPDDLGGGGPDESFGDRGSDRLRTLRSAPGDGS